MLDLITKIAGTLDDVAAALELLNDRITALERRPLVGAPPIYVALPEQDRSSHVVVGACACPSHSGL